MVSSKSGLGGVQEVVVFQVLGELLVDHFLEDLCWIGEQGDGLSFFGSSGSADVFFRSGSTSVCFQSSGNEAEVIEVFRTFHELFPIVLLARLKTWGVDIKEP